MTVQELVPMDQWQALRVRHIRRRQVAGHDGSYVVLSPMPEAMSDGDRQYTGPLGARIKKADPGKVGFEWSWWKALWVVGERTFHIGGRMARSSCFRRLMI